MKFDRFSLLQNDIQTLLNRLGLLVFPAILIALSAFVLLWQMAHFESPAGTPIAIRVWEQGKNSAMLSKQEILASVSAQAARTAYETHLSTQPFWFSLDLSSDQILAPMAINFPSRHATNLTCWDLQSDVMLGTANRVTAEGRLTPSGAGYALLPAASQGSAQLLCRGTFRGPAQISAAAWKPDALTAAQETHQETGTLIEASIGVLAVTMLITAIVNRSWLYLAFVGWLLLNMRMAAISAGTDFQLFGYVLSPALLIESRKWTVCMYAAMTTAMFSLLFREELADIKARSALTAAQIATMALTLACFFVSFENILVALWFCVALGVAAGLYYLYKILRLTQSRVALWYSASIVITLLGSFSEVVAAFTGERLLASGLNSVTAAIASALLVSAAVAEHMRADRLEKLEAQRTLKAAYEDSPIGLFSVGLNEAVLKTNPAFQQMVQSLSIAPPSRISQLFDTRVTADLMSLCGTKSRSIELNTKVHDAQKNSDRWFAIKASTVDGAIIECTLQDITERFVATERLEYLANHDPLTDCLNLRGISRVLGRIARPPSALAYFDLDRFKLINDLYGHAAGDKVLRRVSERMKGAIGPKDMLSRVGGDEFVIAFYDASVAQATVCCEAVVHLIAGQPYLVGQQRFRLNVSAGLVGTARFENAPLKEIISAADTLCRLAKKRTTQRLVVMESDDSFFLHHKQELEVIAYLERGEVPEGLFLVMQPEISLTQPFDSLNFEILLRLRKSGGGVIPAGVIIEAAEMHGKTAIIDRWVFSTAIEWLEINAGVLTNTRFVSINVSGGSLNDEVFTDELFELLAEHPSVLPLICIEITESVALTDIRSVQRFIDRVRALGAKVAIDDFGAGYSSFGYLKNLSVDALKLDGSLVKDATRSTPGLAIIEAIGGLVSSLGMKSIGEYAEDLATIKALSNAGIDYAQGYAISKPVMPERILSAQSSADFIEDPDILEYMTGLQSKSSSTMSLFDEVLPGITH
jgi:diguanylate cyclase (GGDEF)-like protein